MPGKVGRYLLDTGLAALVDGPAVYIISPASPSSGNALPFSKACPFIPDIEVMACMFFLSKN